MVYYCTMNPSQILNAVVADLEAKYRAWLGQLWPIADEGNTFVVGAPANMPADAVEKLRRQIQRSMGSVAGRDVVVRIVLSEPRERGTESSLKPMQRSAADPTERPAVRQDALAGKRQSLSRGAEPTGSRWEPNPSYSFASFVVGASNELAFAACRAAAEEPGKAYNPLLIYGGVGLGKTHLLHAAGHVALDQQLRVLYVSSERFTNDLIHAIAQRRTEEFRQLYRQVDVLLIDDIQFIAGKESTQEEFFHTFNALHEANRQIILSSDRPPKAMAALEQRLRSRFEWGLIADIQPPDFDTRIAILRAKGQNRAIHVPTEVLELIAHRIPSNIRELQGALNRVVAYVVQKKCPLSVEMAESVLDDIVRSIPRRFTTQQILGAVARHYRTDLQKLRGKGRERSIMLPRHVAMFLMRESTMSLSEIGAELGNRDHATVSHACDKIEREIEVNERLRRDVDALREALSAAGR